MQAIQFNEQGELLTTPRQVVADLCTAPTCQEAQDALWAWLQPALLDCYRQEQPDRADRLTAFFEQLEQLVYAVYRMRTPGVPVPTPQQEGGASHA